MFSIVSQCSKASCPSHISVVVATMPSLVRDVSAMEMVAMMANTSSKYPMLNIFLYICLFRQRQLNESLVVGVGRGALLNGLVHTSYIYIYINIFEYLSIFR